MQGTVIAFRAITLFLFDHTENCQSTVNPVFIAHGLIQIRAMILPPPSTMTWLPRPAKMVVGTVLELVKDHVPCMISTRKHRIVCSQKSYVTRYPLNKM